jgi:hypothetical protein
MPVETAFPESFSVAKGERDGLPVVCVLNTALADYRETARFPWLVEIEVRAEETTDSRLPVPAEIDALGGVEQRVQEALSAGGAHFVARQTWNQRQMLDFYVADGPAARRALEGLAAGTGLARELTFKVTQDEHWATWLPTLQQMSEGAPAADGSDGLPEQSLLVQIPLSGGDFGSDEEQEAVLELADLLAETAAEAGVGVLDGYEFGDGQAMLFAYGDDAGALWDALGPVLRGSVVARGGTATVGRGAPGADGCQSQTYQL